MAKRTFLDFEQPIAELESKIEELRYVQTESAVDISEEIEQHVVEAPVMKAELLEVKLQASILIAHIHVDAVHPQMRISLQCAVTRSTTHARDYKARQRVTAISVSATERGRFRVLGLRFTRLNLMNWANFRRVCFI